MVCKAVPGGTSFEVWVQPRASRNQVSGIQGQTIKVRVAAPPVNGEANEALIRFLAKQLDVPRRAVTIQCGHHGRRKTMQVEGLGPEETRKRLGV
jgi:uncharacterized protein (TIGR00251 family)